MRTSIKARDGYILTNGEIFGTEIYLAEGVSEDGFYEITIEEYNAIFMNEEINYELRETEFC